jgi:hypothetical protein
MTFFYINAGMQKLGFRCLSVPYCPLWKGGKNRVGFVRICRAYGGTITLFFKVSISGRSGTLYPMVMVVKRGDATGAWYWKGLPTRTLVFERQTCAPWHKSSKEHLMVMYCENAAGNHN